MVYRQDNRPKRHRGRYTVLGIMFGIMITIGGIYVYDNYNQPIIQKVNQTSNVIIAQVEKDNPVSHTTQNQPNIQDQSQSIQTQQNNPSQNSYSLDELKQATLQDINNYRIQSGLNSIPMENSKASQVWADHLLLEGCIAHREGSVGPIQRYLDNGDPLQMIFENVSGGYGTDTTDPISSLKQANSEMINNDTDQGNAHRNNILNPNHSSVSIGIAYNSNKLILVEDFQERIEPNWKSFDLSYDDSKSCW